MGTIITTETENNLDEIRFVIDTMRWSYSRLEAFEGCKAAWKRKYIDCEYGIGNAFASYGTLDHSLLEQFLKGEKSAFELASDYERRFDEEITEDFPYHKTADLRESYYNKGLKYFSEFTDIIEEDYETLGVEYKVEFKIDDYDFVGFIDFLYRDSAGDIVLADHKTTSAPFKKNGQPTKATAEKIEKFKRQMYLYCKPLIEQGFEVKWLAWNFVNEMKFYKVPFNQAEYEAALKWAIDTIHEIENETKFEPNESFYFCGNICEYRLDCPYHEPLRKEEGLDDGSGFYSEGF